MSDEQPLMHVETVPIETLRPHPRNYRTHTPQQLAHIQASVREHGLYRAVVIARDGTILAGHGVVDAARAVGYDAISVVRLDIDADDPRAIKVLVGDNEIALGAAIDDRLLTDLLRDLASADDLLGTGYDAQQLAALVYVSRPADEIDDVDAAAEWVGLPTTGTVSTRSLKVIVHCVTEADRDAFYALVGAESRHIVVHVHPSIWYPLREKVHRRPVFVETEKASEP